MPGVYGVVGAPASQRREIMAAVLWAGEGAVISHGTAGCPLGHRRHSRPEGRALGSVAARTRGTSGSSCTAVLRVDRADRTTFEPIPVTTPIRSLIDLSARMEDEPTRWERWRASSVGSSVTPERLAARLEALGGSGRPGAGAARGTPRAAR